MKGRAVIETLTGEGDEPLGMGGRNVGPQRDDHLAMRCFHDERVRRVIGGLRLCGQQGCGEQGGGEGERFHRGQAPLG